MNAERYSTVRESNAAYRFHSKGPKGKIELRVYFQKADLGEAPRLYNLAFGTWNADLQTIDDAVELRNGDMDKILATVVYSAFDFLTRNPSVYIFAQGSTAARTRKYQMGIARFLGDVPSGFEILGLVKDRAPESGNASQNWEKFRIGTKYMAFLLYKSNQQT